MKISDKLKSKLKIEKAKLLAVAEYPWSKHDRVIQEKTFIEKKITFIRQIKYLFYTNLVLLLIMSGNLHYRHIT